MGPPTAAQRLDQLEEKASSIEGNMAEMVTKAVEAAITAMKQSLTGLLMEGQATATRQQREELNALSSRLEGRIARSREHQEQMMSLLHAEQLKFQNEMQSTITGIHSHQTQIGDRPEGSAVHKGSNSTGPQLGNSGLFGEAGKRVNAQQVDGVGS